MRFDFNGSARACAKERGYMVVTYWFLFSCRVEDDDYDLSTASTEGLHSKASWCSNTVTSGLNTWQIYSHYVIGLNIVRMIIHVNADFSSITTKGKGK